MEQLEKAVEEMQHKIDRLMLAVLTAALTLVTLVIVQLVK